MHLYSYIHYEMSDGVTVIILKEGLMFHILCSIISYVMVLYWPILMYQYIHV